MTRDKKRKTNAHDVVHRSSPRMENAWRRREMKVAVTRAFAGPEREAADYYPRCAEVLHGDSGAEESEVDNMSVGDNMVRLDGGPRC